MSRDLLLLALCQGLFLSNTVVFMAINGLVGLSLAPQGRLATLPVTGYVVGSAASTGLVRACSHASDASVCSRSGTCTIALCAYAAARQDFWLLVGATVSPGLYAANASLYRFAGPDLVAPAFRERAVSLVLAGGIVGALAVDLRLHDDGGEFLRLGRVGPDAGLGWLNLGSLVPLRLVVASISWLSLRIRADLSEVAAASPAGR